MFPERRSGSRLTNGWQLNSLMTFHGGMPFSVYSSADTSGTDDGNQRADIVPGWIHMPASGKEKVGANWLNPAAFVDAAPGTWGNTSRNAYVGPGYQSVDFSVFKNTPIGERVNTQFRVEMFNLFNRTNFAPPLNGSFNPSYTQTTPVTVHNYRQLQRRSGHWCRRTFQYPVGFEDYVLEILRPSIWRRLLLWQAPPNCFVYCDKLEVRVEMGLTRRDFLMRVGQAGGYGAAFLTMQHLGLMAVPEANAMPLSIESASGKGTKVVILGGGIAGLVAAYEMGKAGYSCTVLEARQRPGGRNWTVRNGTKIEFNDGTTQTANWDDSSYFNAGPARLPSIHKTMLGYCKELGVPLEVEVNTSRSSLLQNDAAFGGKAIEQREAINDTRGHVSELLAKCIHKNALDQEISKDDQERMLAFLRIYGDLKKRLLLHRVATRAARRNTPAPARRPKCCGLLSRCMRYWMRISGRG